jgi:Arc/MetJ-type ribon-helix-helix transcriptional regulator
MPRGRNRQGESKTVYLENDLLAYIHKGVAARRWKNLSHAINYCVGEIRRMDEEAERRRRAVFVE